jgi:diguanylate cyclase (GGDEF)-like protein
MTVSMAIATRAAPRSEDAGSLVLRYQQRMRAELLKKVDEEKSGLLQMRQGVAGYAARAGAPPAVEGVIGMLYALNDPRQFIASGLLLALVTGATSATLILGLPGMLSWLGLLALGIVLVHSVATPARRTALILTAAVASIQTIATLIIDPMAAMPGLSAVAGLIATSFVASRYGFACRQEEAERRHTKRVIDDMQPVDDDAGVLKWAHASLVFDRELSRAHRYGHPLTLLRVVVERWQIVTTALGPEKSAEVLAEVGALLVSSSRVVDIVAYQGEGKFDLLLPDTADLGAVVVARRVSAHVSQHPGVRLRVGVAAVVKQEGTIDELLQQGEDAATTARKKDRPFTVYGVDLTPVKAGRQLVAGRR